jgi:hypothetical protein
MQAKPALHSKTSPFRNPLWTQTRSLSKMSIASEMTLKVEPALQAKQALQNKQALQVKEALKTKCADVQAQ